jgi:hypothetical protein
MGLFDKRPRGRPRKGTFVRKPQTVDEQTKAIEKKEARWAHKELFEQIRTNPETKEALIRSLNKKHFNIDLKIPTRADKAKEELEDNLTQEAIAEIKSNPELRKELALKRAREMLGMKDEPRIDGDIEGMEMYRGGDNQTPMQRMLQDLDDYDAVRERLGGGESKGGMMGGIINSDTINLALKLLIAKMAGGNGSTAPASASEGTVIVAKDGQVVEISKSEYMQLYQSGKLQPIAAMLESPKQPEPQKSIVTSKPTDSEEPVEDKLETLFDVVSPKEIEELLSLSASDFLLRLDVEEAKGETRAVLLKAFLPTLTYEKVVEFITPYKDDARVSKQIEKLLSPEGEDWCKEVLVALKKEEPETELEDPEDE